MDNLGKKLESIEEFINTNKIEDSFVLSSINHGGEIMVRIQDNITCTSVVYDKDHLNDINGSLGAMLYEFMESYPSKYRTEVDGETNILVQHKESLTSSFISKYDWKIVKKLNKKIFPNKKVIYFYIGWISCSLSVIIIRQLLNLF